MFLWTRGHYPSLQRQFLCHSPDVVRLKSTAATTVADDSIVGLSDSQCTSQGVRIQGSRAPGLQGWEQKNRARRHQCQKWRSMCNHCLCLKNLYYWKGILTNQLIPDSCSWGCGKQLAFSTPSRTGKTQEKVFAMFENTAAVVLDRYQK